MGSACTSPAQFKLFKQMVHMLPFPHGKTMKNQAFAELISGTWSQYVEPAHEYWMQDVFAALIKIFETKGGGMRPGASQNIIICIACRAPTIVESTRTAAG